MYKFSLAIVLPLLFSIYWKKFGEGFYRKIYLYEKHSEQ